MVGQMIIHHVTTEVASRISGWSMWLCKPIWCLNNFLGHGKPDYDRAGI